jgi:hypothetical protein
MCNSLVLEVYSIITNKAINVFEKVEIILDMKGAQPLADGC